jgi:ABC-type uncharacterized transport system YnjBCD substrate-binding protein
MKKFLVLIVAVAFVLSAAGFSLAASDDWKGTITKISGDKVTIKDDIGKMRTINMTDGGITKLKVGDTVVVNNGKIISENTGGGGTTTHGPTTHGPTTGGSR